MLRQWLGAWFRKCRQGAVFAAGHGVATKVFLRIDGEWRLWQHHASPVVDTRRGQT